MSKRLTPASIQRRSLIGAGAGLSLLAAAGPILAKPRFSMLRIVCAFAPGGTTDLLSRRVASGISADYAKTVIVENRPGAAGQVGTAFVKQLPPDGNTILMTSMAAFTLAPRTQKSLSYDPVNDFVPLTGGCSMDYIFAVGPMVPASVKSMADYFAWVKLDPRHATVATAGIVSLIAGAVLGKVAGVELANVPYKGGILAIQDLLAGIAPAIVTSVADVNPHLGEGKLRILATMSDKRSAHAPDVPTFAEQGIPDMVYKVSFPFFAHAKTPPDIIESHSAALRRTLGKPEVAEALKRAYMDVLPTDLKETAELLAEDRARWAALTARIGYQPI